MIFISIQYLKDGFAFDAVLRFSGSSLKNEDEEHIHAGEPVSGSRGAPEETPPIGRNSRVERTPAERPDPGTETILASSCDDAETLRWGWKEMERPICWMQGQKTADEFPLEEGGSPLS